MTAVTDEETEKELSVLYEEKRILKGIIKGADGDGIRHRSRTV